MALMIAVERCYLNDRLYEPGETFEWDGAPGRAFHPVDAPPRPQLNLEAALSKAFNAEAKKPAVKGV